MNGKNRYCSPLLAVLLTIGLLSSCLKEDYTDCPRPFQVSIKVSDADGNDITDTGEAGQAVVFIFNESGEIIDAVTLTAEEVMQRKPIDIKIDYPGYESLKFVVWSNLDSNVDYSQISSVSQLNDLFVRLKSENGTAQSPGDLFYGNLEVPIEYGDIEYGKSHTVEITRKTSQIIVTAKNLPKGDDPSDYTFVLRESLDTYNQDGELEGDLVSYNLPISKNGSGDFVTPIFNTFPSANNKPFILEVYKNGELLFTFTKGADDKEFIPEVGRLLNIIIDVKVDASLAVKVVVTPWGVVYQEVEY